MNLKKITLLSSVLLASFCFAETNNDLQLFDPNIIPKKQYAFTYKLLKNGEIIVGHSHIFSLNNPSLIKGWSGGEKNMLFYKCRKGDKETQPYSASVLIDNYPISQCIAKENGDAKCVIRIHNAKDQNALAKNEYNKRSCKEVQPFIDIKKFEINLKETDKNGVKDFGNGYKLQYAYSEFK